MLVIIRFVIIVRGELRVNFLRMRSEGRIATISKLEDGRRGETAPGLSASGQENSCGWIQELDCANEVNRRLDVADLLIGDDWPDSNRSTAKDD